MSTEEIINAWKHNEADPRDPSKGKANPSKGKPNPLAKKAPANPVGEQEISDEDLKAVEGGISPFSCVAFSC